MDTLDTFLLAAILFSGVVCFVSLVGILSRSHMAMDVWTPRRSPADETSGYNRQVASAARYERTCFISLGALAMFSIAFIVHLFVR